MSAPFRLQHLFCEIGPDKSTQFSQRFLWISQQILIAKQPVVVQVREADMLFRRQTILRDCKQHAGLSNEPGQMRMLDRFDGRSRWIIAFGHGKPPRVPRDVDDFAIRKPFEQERNVHDIDRKLHTAPFTAAETG